MYLVLNGEEDQFHNPCPFTLHLTNPKRFPKKMIVLGIFLRFPKPLLRGRSTELAPLFLGIVLVCDKLRWPNWGKIVFLGPILGMLFLGMVLVSPWFWENLHGSQN